MASHGAAERWTECSDCGWNLGTDHMFSNAPVEEMLSPGAECPACGEPVHEVVEATALDQAERERDEAQAQVRLLRERSGPKKLVEAEARAERAEQLAERRDRQSRGLFGWKERADLAEAKARELEEAARLVQEQMLGGAQDEIEAALGGLFSLLSSDQDKGHGVTKRVAQDSTGTWDKTEPIPPTSLKQSDGPQDADAAQPASGTQLSVPPPSSTGAGSESASTAATRSESETENRSAADPDPAATGSGGRTCPSGAECVNRPTGGCPPGRCEKEADSGGSGEGEGKETIEELVAQGRCPECGTLQGVWHKLGCSRDPWLGEHHPDTGSGEVGGE